jgi:opacity protein-like surface antigen
MNTVTLLTRRLSSFAFASLFACAFTLTTAGAAMAQLPDPTDPQDHRPAPPASSADQKEQRPPQQKPKQTPPATPPSSTRSAPQEKPFRVAGFVEFGNTWFTASKSFDAILNANSGPIVGGGGQFALKNGIFVQVDIAHFGADGSRAYVFNNQVYKLNEADSISATPIDLSVGYRFRFGHRPVRPGTRAARRQEPSLAERLVPYVGGGVGTVLYKETSAHAQPGDNIDQSSTSYNFLAGLEIGVWRFIGAGVEFHQRWVPDGLGKDGVSKAFNETDLGGSTIRFKVIVGF